MYRYLLQFTFKSNSPMYVICDVMHIACPIHNKFIYIFLTKNLNQFQGNEIKFRGNEIG